MQGGTNNTSLEIEDLVRLRLKSLRVARGYSLDELSSRSHLSPSVISRIENGKRTIGLDVLVPLAAALHASLDQLLDSSSDQDVVIRPVPSREGKHTTWLLSRPDGPMTVLKMRIEPTKRSPAPKVHPGHDWFFVTEGRVRLLLGEREMIVETGEAAEFATMTPHAITVVDRAAELVMIFDRDGSGTHIRHELKS